MTKEDIVKVDENGQPVIDVAREEILAEIQVSIDKLLRKRKDARKKFGKLKRTPFEAVEDKGLMNPESLFEESTKIEAKQSTLGMSERNLITQIVTISMQNVFERKINEAREAAEKLDKPELPKKKRTKKPAKKDK